jgi:secretion/DNA translocation related CpaE-like protein
MDLEAAPSITTPPALVLIRDTRLRDEVRRVAAAAERGLDERELPVGRHAWTGAPLVILETAAARECAEAGYLRRVGVVLVTDGEPGLIDWQAAAAVGAERVVALPGAAVGLIEKFAEHGENRVGDGAVVAIAGAGGGAGASTLAAATALRSAAERFRRDTVLVDGAPLGGGLDMLLGIETTAGLRWPDLVIEDGRVSAAALHSALPAAAPGLAVLSCGRGGAGRLPSAIGSAAVRAVVEAGRAAGDLVVCDVSGERGPHADQMLDSADLVVLVVPARLRAVAAAESVAAYIGQRNPNQGLVVRGPAPGGLRGTEVAEVLDLPLLASVRAQTGLAARLERGGLTVRRRGPLRDAADAVLAVLSAPSGRGPR